MIKPVLIDLNSIDHKHYPFIDLDKCNGSCSSVDDLSTKRSVPDTSQDMNVKAFNMITYKNRAKTLVYDFSTYQFLTLNLSFSFPFCLFTCQMKF